MEKREQIAMNCEICFLFLFDFFMILFFLPLVQLQTSQRMCPPPVFESSPAVKSGHWIQS